MRCDELRDVLAEAAEGAAVRDRRARRHVETCIRCQAELAQYRRLLRALRTMRADVVEPDPGLLPGVLAVLQAAGERQAVRSVLSGRRVAYVGGIAAATAGAAGAIVLVSLSRRGRLRLAG